MTLLLSVRVFSGLAAAIKLNEAGLTNFKIIEKQASVVLGVKIPIRAVVVMYLRLCTLTRLLQVQNGAIYLHVSRKF